MGMRPESAVQSVSVQASLPEGDIPGEIQGRATFAWSVPLAALGGRFEELRIGLTAVIEDIRGRITYWAIAHAGDKPDFHLHQSFVARPLK